MATPDVPSAQELYGISMENNLVISGPAGMSDDVVAALEGSGSGGHRKRPFHGDHGRRSSSRTVYRSSDDATQFLNDQAESTRAVLAE